MKSRSKDRTPTTVNLTVKRRYLTEREVERLIDCARKYGRYGHRDATMILVAYRHGLRASEVCDLQWQQIELSEGRLHVHRVKNGISSVHPIRGDEMIDSCADCFRLECHALLLRYGISICAMTAVGHPRPMGAKSHERTCPLRPRKRPSAVKA